MSFTPSPLTPNPPTAVPRSATPPPVYSSDVVARRQLPQHASGSFPAQASSSFRRSLDKSSSPIDQSDNALILDGNLSSSAIAEASNSTAVAIAPMGSNPRHHDSPSASLRSVPSSPATLFTLNTSHSQPGTNADLTVTPLHLLGDQADFVDCPFCRRRVETRIKKDPSTATHVAATGLFLTTIGGVVAPYARHWKCHVTHICTNCDKKVAVRRHGSNEMKPLGTPDHLRQISRFPAARAPAKRL